MPQVSIKSEQIKRVLISMIPSFIAFINMFFLFRLPIGNIEMVLLCSLDLFIGVFFMLCSIVFFYKVSSKSIIAYKKYLKTAFFLIVLLSIYTIFSDASKNGWSIYVIYSIVILCLHIMFKEDYELYIRSYKFGEILGIKIANKLKLFGRNEIMKKVLNMLYKIIKCFIIKCEEYGVINYIATFFICMIMDILNFKIEFFLIFLIFPICIEFYLLKKIYVERHSQKNYEMITYLNLDYSDILEHNIYYDSVNLGGNKRIFKVDLTNLFPLDAVEKNILILNHQYINMKGEFKKDGYLYLVVDINNNFKSIKLKMILEYKYKNKITHQRYNVFIDKQKINSEIILTNLVFEKLHKKICMPKPDNMLLTLKKDDLIKEFSCILKKTYVYDKENLISNVSYLFEGGLNDSRKWLMHDGNFGVGKSVLDFSFIANMGYRPIIISPWEENYDNDILYLIYSKVMAYTKAKPLRFDKSITIFLVAIIIAIGPLIYSCLNKISSVIYETIMYFNLNISNKIRTLLDENLYNFFREGFDFDFFLIIISIYLAFKVSRYLIPIAIIHVKNTTKIHQSYYLRGIKKAINENNIMLIIEDIDRLEESSALNTFRTLASINTLLNNRKKPIGILSYDHNRISFGNDLNNKIIYGKIFEDISMEESMKLYFLSYFKTMSEIKNTTYDEKKVEEEFVNMGFNNFRDINVFLDKITMNGDINHKELIDES